VYVVTADPPKADSASADTKKTGATTRGSGGGGGIPGTVAVREVTVGASQAAVGSDGEDTTVVLSGIGPGETVVTDGVDKLQDGSKVLARPSARKAATRPAATQESSTTQPTHRRRRPQNNE
jgi:multidrug efflux system membrane fusion protein